MEARRGGILLIEKQLIKLCLLRPGPLEQEHHVVHPLAWVDRSPVPVRLRERAHIARNDRGPAIIDRAPDAIGWGRKNVSGAEGEQQQDRCYGKDDLHGSQVYRRKCVKIKRRCVRALQRFHFRALT
jgi:hypothetical protein